MMLAILKQKPAARRCHASRKPTQATDTYPKTSMTVSVDKRNGSRCGVAASVPALAQDMFQQQRRPYERQLGRAERALTFQASLCDLARRDPSSAACRHLQSVCTSALESGVEDGVGVLTDAWIDARITSFHCVILCWISTPSQSAEISGAWKIETQGGPTPLCSLVQVGNNLNGSCVGPQATGTVTGTVVGPTVQWRWQWVTYAGNAAAAFDFVGTLESDNTITGRVERRETGMSLTFTAKRQIVASGAPPAQAQGRPQAPVQQTDQVGK